MPRRGRGRGGNAQGGNPQQQRAEYNKMVSEAVGKGFSLIMQDNPILPVDYLQRHVDQDKLNGVISTTYDGLRRQRLRPEEATRRFQYAIANAVVKGEVFDDRAKTVILREGLKEDKPNLVRRVGDGIKTFFGGTVYHASNIRDVTKAFNDMSYLLESGQYSDRIGQLKEDITLVRDAGFLDNAFAVLHSYGIMDKNKYQAMRKVLRKKVETSAYTVLEKMTGYAEEMKQAAAILSFSGGIILAASAVNMTGNVVANGGSLSLKVIELCLGLGFLVSGVLLFKKYAKAPKKSLTRVAKRKKRG